jgi:hypothetical protein
VTSSKIVEHWSNSDDLGMLEQLGVISRPGQDKPTLSNTRRTGFAFRNPARRPSSSILAARVFMISGLQSEPRELIAPKENEQKMNTFYS